MKKKVLITGAGGFAGRNLSEYFGGKKELYEVFPPSHSELDLLDEAAVTAFLNKNKVNLVVHCANCGGTRKTRYDAGSVDVVSRNLRMFFNLVRALPVDSRMLSIGSGAEYDRRAYTPKMPEGFFDSHVPADAYGYSKYLVSKYVERLDNVVNLRVFGLFGKYEDYTFRFISNAIVRNLMGLPIIINQNVVFDYLYITDFVRMVEAFVSNAPKFTSYNLTPSTSVDLLSLSVLINQVADRPSPIQILSPGMNREYTGDNSRFLDEFPDFKFTPYCDSVKDLYMYYKKNFDKLNLEDVRSDLYIQNCRANMA